MKRFFPTRILMAKDTFIAEIEKLLKNQVLTAS